MPTERDDSENLPETGLHIKEGTNGRRAMAFLAANDGHAFTRSEIRDGTGISDGSIGAVLTRLADDGLLDHQGQYWTLSVEDVDEIDSEALLAELRAEWNEGW
ncbi:MarR family transcriptional regulator [Haladaptatus cibarius]|uniref:MarR family transcriptional regulator n=1 Tax=Haladaptatus cibarius TaxID=453847 RepID=UPI000678CFE0|nr:helix-turn-helix domain-containing protein [Haladaptatus cibarius]